MRATAKTSILKANIFTRKLVNLSLSPSAIILTSEGDAVTISASVPALCCGSGADCVSMEGDTLRGLAIAQDSEQLTLELFADYLCHETASSFVSLNGAVGRPIQIEQPDDKDYAVLACDLCEPLSQCTALAKLERTDVTISLLDSKLQLSTGGNRAQATIDLGCCAGSGSWRLTTKDASALVKLLRRQSRAEGSIQCSVAEGNLRLVCERWQVAIHETAKAQPEVLITYKEEGARIVIADLRRALDRVLAIGATAVNLVSRGRVLSVSTDCADLSTGKVIATCNGAISATWDAPLLARFLQGASGTVLINEHIAQTRFATLCNPLTEFTPSQSAATNRKTRKLVHG